MEVAASRRWAIPLGLLLATGVGLFCRWQGLAPAASWTAGIASLCAFWWMSEALPLPATALLPLALFPFLGILSPDQVASAYGNPLILLFLGGFLLSAAIESSGAHRHIALSLLHKIGSNGKRLVLGFMLTSALLSMWISNTATTLMLLPVALAVCEAKAQRELTVALLLAVAYGASIGGLGTPIGSPPNLVFLQVYQDLSGEEIGFIGWMQMGLPVVLLMLPAAAWWLARSAPTQTALELPPRGAWTTAQRRVLIIFALTALGWMTRSDPWGGWSSWLGLGTANDASVALLGALALFLLPSGRADGERLLNWESAQRIPWGMLILFGGGIAIAKAFASSGLSAAFGQGLLALMNLPLFILILGICLSVTFLTEINSNTATAVLLLPILGAAAVGAELDPRLLMLPAAFSASCAFMLPVATPPNAIVFGSGQIPINSMLHRGLALNLLGATIISLLCYWRL